MGIRVVDNRNSMPSLSSFMMNNEFKPEGKDHICMLSFSFIDLVVVFEMNMSLFMPCFMADFARVCACVSH